MRLIDRYIVRNFLFNYLLAFTVVVGLYILLDLIVNFDQFTHAQAAAHAGNWSSFTDLVGAISSFYMYRTLLIFQQVCGIIPLLAAGFTMFRMTRNRELTALLASGISLYRVAVPIIICAIGFNMLVVLDQEVLMPDNINKLLRTHSEVDAATLHPQPIYFIPESDNSLVLASRYNPATETLTHVRIIQRNKVGLPISRIIARRAVWKNNIGEGPHPGGWLMTHVTQINDLKSLDPHETPQPEHQMIYYTPLNPHQLKLIFAKKTVDYLSTAQIDRLMMDSPPSTRDALEKIMYTRFTQLIVNLLMLMIGIPFLLTREPTALIKNMLACTMVTGICFITTFVLFQLAGTAVSPIVGAWLPVLLFTPLAVVMLEGIKT